MSKIAMTVALMLTFVGCKGSQTDPQAQELAAKAKAQAATAKAAAVKASAKPVPAPAAMPKGTAVKNEMAAKAETKAMKAVAKIEVSALAKLVTDKKPVSIYDANGAETRKKEGVIPGAKLLTDVSKYTTEELPKDKAEKLVFYCYNEQCPASHKAAEKAIISGYSDVNILPSGIMGWKKAGNKTQTIQ